MLPSQLSDIVGPTLIELPIRYIFQETNNDDDENLWSVAKCLQKRFLEDSMYEVVGMEDILKFALTETESGRADFGWRTGFQKAEDEDDEEEEGSSGSFLDFPACKLEVFDRPHPPRTRPEIYATPRRGKGKEKGKEKGGDWLEISFEGNRVLQSEEMVRGVVEEIAELLFVNCCGGSSTEK